MGWGILLCPILNEVWVEGWLQGWKGHVLQSIRGQQGDVLQGWKGWVGVRDAVGALGLDGCGEVVLWGCSGQGGGPFSGALGARWGMFLSVLGTVLGTFIHGLSLD